MKKILYFIFSVLISINFSNCEIITGKINHNDFNNKIIDSKTKQGIANAKVSIPELNYSTYTDSNGMFQLNADITDKTILFVEHDGYKVFSLAIDNNVLNSPLKLGIEKSTPFDMQVSVGVIHLGDNMFSSNSANSSEFKLYAKGPSYSQQFKMPSYSASDEVVVKIGTIIGLDTRRAKEAGQNRIAKVFSSPMEVFINGSKIGKIELNGNDIEVLIPKNILQATNELVIKTGQNLFQTEYIDYDDCELANIRIETKAKKFWAKK